MFRIRHIRRYNGGLAARGQALALMLAGSLLRPFRFRGIGRLSRFLGAHVFSRENSVTVALFGHSRFTIRLGDYYWSRLLFLDFQYEAEVEHVLSWCLKPDTLFLDCGANTGYWSVYASERVQDPRRLVAVEAALTSFQCLEDNARLNPGRMTCVHAALSDQAGKEIEFLALAAHAASRIRGLDRDEDGTEAVETVMTTTIDDLCRQALSGSAAPVVIKLDVEGAEILALRGATETLRTKEVLLIYEEQELDASCAVSRYVREELEFDIFRVDELGGCRRIGPIDEIRKIKTIPEKGYNFVGCAPGSTFNHALRSREHPAS